jgi:hypothetical protein
VFFSQCDRHLFSLHGHTFLFLLLSFLITPWSIFRRNSVGLFGLITIVFITHSTTYLHPYSSSQLFFSTSVPYRSKCLWAYRTPLFHLYFYSWAPSIAAWINMAHSVRKIRRLREGGWKIFEFLLGSVKILDCVP